MKIEEYEILDTLLQEKEFDILVMQRNSEIIFHEWDHVAEKIYHVMTIRPEYTLVRNKLAFTINNNRILVVLNNWTDNTPVTYVFW